MISLNLVWIALYTTISVHKVMGSSNDTNIDPFIDSRLNIHIPFGLHESSASGYPHVKADYGFRDNNRGSIHTFVYFVDGPLCDPISPIRHNISTTPSNKNSSEDSGEAPGLLPNDTMVYPINDLSSIRTFQTPFILMARSEHCSSVVKARNAQAIGAAAFVIGHEHCLCSDSECIEQYGNACVEPPIYLVNDGSAGDITIPSFLLYKVAAERIVDQLKNQNQPVLMELTWGLAPVIDETVPENPVMFHLFTTAHNPLVDHDDLRSLQLVDAAFSNEQAQFYPNYAIVDGSRFGCNSGDNSTYGPCAQSCTNYGRYCTIHASGDVTGHDILKETVRQICIWKHFSSIDADGGKNNPDVYWNYVRYHRLHCTGKDYASDECIHDAMLEAKVALTEGHGALKRSKVIDDCMAESGDMDSDKRSPLLDYHMERQMEYGIIEVPAISVNKHELENTSPYHLFQAICGYYWKLNYESKNYPDICDKCGVCENIIGCLARGGQCVDFPHHHYHHQQYGNQSGYNWSTWIFWTVCLGLLIGGGRYYNIRRGNGYHGHWIGGSADSTRLTSNYFSLNGNDPFLNSQNTMNQASSQLLEQVSDEEL